MLYFSKFHIVLLLQSDYIFPICNGVMVPTNSLVLKHPALDAVYSPVHLPSFSVSTNNVLMLFLLKPNLGPFAFLAPLA
jgi:hypothetical protein